MTTANPRLIGSETKDGVMRIVDVTIAMGSRIGSARTSQLGSDMWS